MIVVDPMVMVMVVLLLVAVSVVSTAMSAVIVVLLLAAVSSGSQRKQRVWQIAKCHSTVQQEGRRGNKHHNMVCHSRARQDVADNERYVCNARADGGDADVHWNR